MSNVLPTDPKERKSIPLVAGVLDYFPAALAEVAIVSRVANEQHNPGQPLHWAWGKSNDHADCIVRHLVDRGRFDSDGLRHSAKVAWRALALLQEELVNDGVAPYPRAAWLQEVKASFDGVAPEEEVSSGEICIANYDEWMAFKRWQQSANTATDVPPVPIDVAIDEARQSSPCSDGTCSCPAGYCA